MDDADERAAIGRRRQPVGRGAASAPAPLGRAGADSRHVGAAPEDRRGRELELGLHVHVDLSAWGESIVPRLLDAALETQDALRTLLGTSEHRRMYCPPVTPAMRDRYAGAPCARSLRYPGRPQSRRCGINAAPWYDIGTVEIRYANGSLDDDEALRTIELCLRFVAAVGEGRALPNDPSALAAALGAPAAGYPPAAKPPRWYRERMWLEEALAPIAAPIVARHMPGGEVLSILPVPEGQLVEAEDDDQTIRRFTLRPKTDGWEVASVS